MTKPDWPHSDNWTNHGDIRLQRLSMAASELMDEKARRRTLLQNFGALLEGDLATFLGSTNESLKVEVATEDGVTRGATVRLQLPKGWLIAEIAFSVERDNLICLRIAGLDSVGMSAEFSRKSVSHKHLQHLATQFESWLLNAAAEKSSAAKISFDPTPK